jgi:FixJ family two-component response regulator
MLTPRQMEVAELVARGRSYKAVAARLGISPLTVRDHVQEAALRIPLPGPPKMRVVLWFLTLREEES